MNHSVPFHSVPKKNPFRKIHSLPCRKQNLFRKIRSVPFISVPWKTVLPKCCPKVAQKWLRDLNTEMVTRMVRVRAVNVSTRPFCTEFRCEHFCDDAAFWIGVNMWGSHSVPFRPEQKSVPFRSVPFQKTIRSVPLPSVPFRNIIRSVPNCSVP